MVGFHWPLKVEGSGKHFDIPLTGRFLSQLTGSWEIKNGVGSKVNDFVTLFFINVIFL